MKRLLILAVLLSCACSPQVTHTVAPVTLAPYATRTPLPPTSTATPRAQGPVLPSPTPFIYTTQAGDTLGGIALKFGVSLEDLQAANPDVSPNSMSVGKVLRIPSDPDNPSGEPTPMPAVFKIEQVQCYRTGLGAWCFVLARNESPNFMENVSVQITLLGPDGASLASQPALLPLNILPPGSALPLAAFFNGPPPDDLRADVRVLTAISLSPGDPRYLPASIQNEVVEVDWNGRYASVRGSAWLPPESKAAATVWIAATAYDEQGRVAGVRRWEGSGLQPGGALPFDFSVSSLGGPIDRVELSIEARP